LPESLLNRRLKLGRFLGIDLFVHWTFGLVIVYVAFMTRQMGIEAIAFSIAQLLGVFFCVTLHEYGHAMAARRFGISTVDITLLPIGGVARLKQMPRIPWQELIVAVAGPAVNVVISAMLILGFVLLADANVLSDLLRFFVAPFFGFELNDQTTETLNRMFSAPSISGYAAIMLVVNIMLVLFNMIPAFPMDGGRVFRSVLAMGIDYRKATRLAARVGLGCAGILAFLALSSEPPRLIPVMIAAFVGYAGMAEARQVDVMESVRGLTVGDVMVRMTDSLPMDMPLGQIIARWSTSPVPSLPVVSIVGTVVGMLDLRDIHRAVAAKVDLQTPAGQLIDHEKSVSAVHFYDSLESALTRAGRQRRYIPVVNEQDQLCGIIDLETMIVRSELARSISFDPLTSEGRFDRTT
jgi:Zn-dependent protease